MANSDKIILVTGATSQQGGAAARHLLADGWRMRALVREPSKSAALPLARQCAELVHDLEDRASSWRSWNQSATRRPGVIRITWLVGARTIRQRPPRQGPPDDVDQGVVAFGMRTRLDNNRLKWRASWLAWPLPRTSRAPVGREKSTRRGSLFLRSG
jgi:hypothetical protein